MEIKRNINYKDICKNLVNKDLTSLSKAITLIESNNKNDRLLANKILSELQNKNEKNTLRIGVTGVPGAGKSTFIENFGSNLTDLGKKVAVLTIDPSSTISKGSILGDKTRMEKLSQNKNVFIRPTAASNFQGGVAKNTRESIFLCESAGYDVIIVETVGVGQNEISVSEMVDFFLLLKIAGSGDELQGIKRGIMEVADIIVVNKADGNNKNQAQITAKEYSMALNLKPKNKNQWIPKIIVASAYEKNGIQPFIEKCLDFDDHVREKWKHLHRKEQMKYWAKKNIQYLLMSKIDQYNNKINSNIENGVLPERLARDILE